MSFEYEVHPRAQVYYDRTGLADALQAAKERVEEWAYEDDPHGYCHERPDWVRLIEAVEDARVLASG